MPKLETPLIANRTKRQLSALGYKQLSRFIAKAAEINGTHRFSKDFKPMQAIIEKCVYSLIFDHHVTKEQLSQLQRNIKINNGKLELPSIAN